MGVGTLARKPIPALIGTAIGGFWAVMGALALPSSIWLVAVAVALVTTLMLAARLWFFVVPAGHEFHHRTAFRVAVGLEVLALIAAGYFLTRYHLESYLVPVIGIIVGLHFIGLWRASGYAAFLWMASTMCAISAAAIALPAAPPGALNPRALFTSYGNALVLWSGGLFLVQKKKRAEIELGPKALGNGGVSSREDSGTIAP